MLVAIDIGNTNAKFALISEDNLFIKFLTISTSSFLNKQEIYRSFVEWLHQKQNYLTQIKTVVVGTVVKDYDYVFNQVIKEVKKKYNLNMQLIVCNSKNLSKIDKDLFSCKYPLPLEIGADVISCAIAGRKIYKSPCVIVDLGTCTDYVILDNNGEFISGIITPGLHTSLIALLQNTSLLPKIELVAAKSIIGKSTKECIQNGLIVGEAARIEGLIRRIENHFDNKVSVVLTGGFSEVVSEHLEIEHDVDKLLNFKGLKLYSDNML